jgi:alkanesulfonate monooxygenase SsuD/methylene tetrahydromethanopterin reductase-like flavin-dependent oxidoreductase (luciferase family)
LPEHPPHNERYERAREYLDVITKLWDSWEDDALVNDPASGIFADTSKIHPIDHVMSVTSAAIIILQSDLRHQNDTAIVTSFPCSPHIII